MLTLLSAAGALSEYSPAQIAKWIVVIAAIIALVVVALKYFQVQIPPFAVACFWIVLVAAVVIFAIGLVASM